MKMNIITPDIQSRTLDICAIENALVDLLVRGEESDLQQMGMNKGIMQLVSLEQQVRALGHLGKLTTEVELGGSAANALRGAALLGSKTCYSSAVALDKYGRAFSERLEELSIRNQLAVVSGGDTGTCLVVVTPDGERTLNTYLGVCREYRKEFVPESDIAKAKIFFTTGYMWDTPNQIEAVEFALDRARESGTLVALDVADPFVVNRSREAIEKQIQYGVDILFANAEEAHSLIGCKGQQAAQMLAEKVKIAIVKDGAQGAYIGYEGGKTIHIPTTKVAVKDTTGAGDMFAAGFLHALTQGHSLKTAGEIATILASDVVTHVGVRLSQNIPSRVEQHLNTH